MLLLLILMTYIHTHSYGSLLSLPSLVMTHLGSLVVGLLLHPINIPSFCYLIVVVLPTFNLFVFCLLTFVSPLFPLDPRGFEDLPRSVRPCLFFLASSLPTMGIFGASRPRLGSIVPGLSPGSVLSLLPSYFGITGASTSGGWVVYRLRRGSFSPPRCHLRFYLRFYLSSSLLPPILPSIFLLPLLLWVF